MNKIKVTANNEIAPGIYSLCFPGGIPFVPGQVISITTDRSVPSRMYSIASGIHEPEIRIIYDIKPEGILTNMLKKLTSADYIYISEPFGQFVSSGDNSWYIATGTGIAPFYSMFRSERIKNGTVIHGARTQELFLFSEEFTATLKERYIPCCSGNSFPKAFPGRVTEYLKRLPSLDLEINYYLCGNANMVVDVRDLLISKGVPFKNIVSEIYF